jgi:hypothetical protein
LPDWAATVIFVSLALIMFVTFVCSETNNPFFKFLALVAGGAAAYLYWLR